MSFRIAIQTLTAVLALIAAGHSRVRAVTFEIADATEFAKIVDTNAQLTTHATINAWLEGPTWIPATTAANGYLVFCDVGNDRLKKLVPPSTLTDFYVPPAKTAINGTLLDSQERLLCAEAGITSQRISRLISGVPTGLVNSCNGLKFYSPNDIAVKSDGTIWFTDPNYNSGAIKGSAGYPTGYNIYRFDPTTSTCTPVMTDNLGRSSGLARPNGLCFSADETRLYVADSDNSVDGHRLYAYNVTASNTLTSGRVFANINNGTPDGIKCDADGPVWSSAGNGLHVYAPDGHLIGLILIGLTANLCFGGPQYKTLYIVGQPNVWSMPVLASGPQVLKKLQMKTQNGVATVSWPTPSTGWSLQETQHIETPTSWAKSARTIVAANGLNTVTLKSNDPSTFFRLKLDYAAAAQTLVVNQPLVLPKSNTRTGVVVQRASAQTLKAK